MGNFAVNKTACNGDGICTKVCPRALLILLDGVPVLSEEKEARCNHCGQCLAFCPGGAITLPPYTDNDSPPLDPSLGVSPQQAVQMIKGRRSVRLFKDEPVSRQVLDSILDAANMAPTGGNNRLVRWVVVEKQETTRRIAGFIAEWFDSVARYDPVLSKRYAIDNILARFRAGKDVILRDAPHLVLCAMPDKAVWGPVDCAIALTNFDLVANAFGVGCCWAGYCIKATASSPAIRDLLQLEPDVTVYGAMIFGNARFVSYRVPPRSPMLLTRL